MIDETVRRLAAEIDATTARLPDVGADRDLDVPVTAWLEANDVPADTTAFMLAFTAMMGGGEPSHMSMLGVVLDAAQEGYRFDQVLGDLGSSLVDGTSSLVDAIAADASADVRLSSPVVRIRSSDDGVVADIAAGGEVRGAAAIVALPLHVWVDVAFDPPLGEAKRRAAIGGHAGAATKVLAIVEHVPEGFFGIGWPAPLQGLIAGQEVAGGRLVTGFSGTRAIRADDRDAVERAVRAFLPDARVAVAGGHDWVTDPYCEEHLVLSQAGLVRRRAVCSHAHRRTRRVRRFRHRGRGRRVDRGRGAHRARGRRRRAPPARRRVDRIGVHPAAIIATPTNAAATPTTCQRASRSCRNQRASSTVATG